MSVVSVEVVTSSDLSLRRASALGPFGMFIKSVSKCGYGIRIQLRRNVNYADAFTALALAMLMMPPPLWGVCRLPWLW